MSLREYLVQCPDKYGYDTTQIKAMRAGLRRRLFQEATLQNKYIHWLFDDEENVLNPRPSEWLKQPCMSHDSRPCVRSLRQGEPAYRCNTCGLDDTCVLCQFCYAAEDHVGHDVLMRITHRNDTGICDCGDLEAWNVPLRCAASDSHADAGQVPDELVEAMSATVSQALDFVLDIMSASHTGIQFMNKPGDIVANTNESQLDASVYGVGDVPGDGRYSLSLWNDERRSFLDATLAIKLAAQKTTEFGVMVARRIDSYGRGMIKVSPSLETLLDIKRSINLFTCTIRSTRDYMREEMVDEIIHWLVDVSWSRPRSGPTATFRNIIGEAMYQPWNCGNAHLNKGNAMSSDMEFPNELWQNSLLDGNRIPRLEDRTKSMKTREKRNRPSHLSARFGDQTLSHDEATDDGSLEGSLREDAPPSPDMLEFEEAGMTFSAISREKIWVHDESEAQQQRTEGLKPQLPENTHRFKYLIFFDMRFWKSARQSLQDLYVSALIGNPKYKMEFGIEYANMYPQIAELYVLLDREPEVSCIQSLSTQLFTTPTIATELLKSTFYFSQYLASLYTLLTLQKIGPLSCITENMRLDVESPILKNRRFGQLFHELTFLLSRNTNKKTIPANSRSLLQVADFLSLCQGISPVKRETDKHIEYESESWVFVFTTVPFVLQLGQGVAAGAFDCTLEENKGPIAGVAQLLMRWAFLYTSRAQNRPLGSVKSSAEYAGRLVECTLNDYDTTKEIVSLHHPVHAFLSYLLQSCHLDSVESLQQVLFSGNQDLREMGFDEMFVRSMLFEHSIQCLAVLSQIRIGLWVRNGYGMRSQLHHYRENTLRELAYAQDLFMAQAALVSLDTNVAFIQLVQRWNLADSNESTVFDEHQRYYILEEFLHTLNILLVDRVYLQDRKREDINQEYFRREIVQTLVFHDMSYTEITCRVPETMTADDAFEFVLKASTNFTPPKGVNDVGIYSLKPELYQEFNPHYTHFSTTRIEEAEGAIARRLADHHKLNPKDIVHLAPLTKGQGPWADMGAFTRSVAFASFMSGLISALINTRAQKHKADAETVLNSALYLLLMAAKDDLVRDHSQSVQSDGVFSTLKELVHAENNGKSMYQLLQEILQLPHLSAMHIRVHKLFELLGADSVDAASRIGVDSIASNPGDDDIKEKGKQAKAKIMEEIRRQQVQFQQANEQDDDEPMADENTAQEDESGWVFAKSNCVLCHIPDNGTSVFGQMTFTSPVSILRQHDDNWCQEGYGKSSSLDLDEPVVTNEFKENEWWNKYATADADTSIGRAYPSDKVRPSVGISGCGHNVHYACFRDYITNQRPRSDQVMRLTAEDYRRGEYLCPLCRALNNSFIPIVWQKNTSTASDILGDFNSDQVVMIEQLGNPNSIPVMPDQAPALLVDKYIRNEVKEMMHTGDQLRSGLSEQVVQVDAVFDQAKDFSEIENGGIFPAYADTIRCLEISLRGRGNPSPYGGILLDQMGVKQLKNLRLLGHYMEPASEIDQVKEPLKFTEFDPFSHFIACLYWLCPKYHISPAAALRWAYTICISQQVHVIRSGTWSLPNYNDLEDDQVAAMLANGLKGVDPQQAYSMIARNVTIFLRRASLAVHAIAGQYDEDDFKFMTDKPEHERLCLYLSLPTLEEMLVNLADPQSDDYRLSVSMGDIATINMKPIEYPGIYKLVGLPPRLDCFFNMRDETKNFPLDPAVCLFCGALVPFQSSLMSTNERGQCSKHVDECSKFYGIYILPRRNFLYLTTNNKRGSFTEAPFLDAHGEPDDTMRRGRAHFLHPIRWENIYRKLWLDNEIFDVIARKIDQNVDYGGWETI